MKRNLTLLFVLFYFSSYSQNLQGNYYNSKDYFNFNQDTVRFNYSDKGGLVTYRYGSGKFEIKDGYLLIHTGEYIGEKSVFQEVVQNPDRDKFKVIVKDYETEPVFGASVLLLDSKNNIINGTNIEKQGFVSINSNNNIEKVRIMFLGYDLIEFDYNNGNDYLITLGECCVYENRTLLFKIISNDETKLHLRELSTNFDLKDFNKKSIKKLERKRKKTGDLLIGLDKG